MTVQDQINIDQPLGFLRRFLRRRQLSRLYAELDPHLLYDIGLLDVEPHIRRNHRQPS
jgi:uncharacterized protein YjiS (DUF1127 family)